jgi:hypothetical protein
MVKISKYDLETQARTGMRLMEIFWDVLDNPSQYPASLVATVEQWREAMIAALEEGLREELSHGNTEVASMLSRLLQVFHHYR